MSYQIQLAEYPGKRLLGEINAFVQKQHLKLSSAPEFSVVLRDEFTDDIIATGSLEDRVIKYVATDPQRQGENLCAAVISRLIAHQVERGESHIFLYTKPENLLQFSELGFYLVGKTDQALLMENIEQGADQYAKNCADSIASGKIGVIVANCNPFTNGHLYLAQQAAQQCDYVYFFLLSEDKSTFSAQDRYAMAQAGLSGLSNVILRKTGRYLVSAATFPDYFLKEEQMVAGTAGEMDADVFCRHFAAPLQISVRFVGQEPFCPVTKLYNESLKRILPTYGVEVKELERYSVDGTAVSASSVRALLKEGKTDSLMQLVPSTTLNYILSSKNASYF